MKVAAVRAWSPARSVGLAWRGALVLGLVLLATHDGFGLGGHGQNSIFDRWIYDAIDVLASLGCLARAVSVRRERAAWLWIGIALLCSTGGDVLYDALYHGNPPFPSFADASYLAFYPACYLGIGLLLRGRIARLGASAWLDGLMAASTAAAVGAAVLVKIVADSTHGSQLVVLTNLAYPLGDVLLLALVAFVFSTTGWRPGRAWALIAAGLIVVTIGDGTFLLQTATNSYREGTLVDLAWPAALSLLALAAWQAPARAGKSSQDPRTLLGMPITCGLVAVAVFVGAATNLVHPVATAFAIVTIVLVLVRTALTFRENGLLLEHSRQEALTDALTGLANRRKLVADLAGRLETASADTPFLLARFDLNGFKSYNDTFGHPAGDALLERLAGKLAAAVSPAGHAYRMGGDEFCVLLPASELALHGAARALTESGESFSVTSSYGVAHLPREARSLSAALSLADERLYVHKERLAVRRGAAHELLLRTIAEREPGLRSHSEDVATLAVAVAKRLGFNGEELEDVRLAAELHDVGKLAIPDAILLKQSPLDDDEWLFVRQHTLIGQRILGGSPALSRVGVIVRSTHESWDGSGYPDGLSGNEIPQPARVVSACDAYSAMTSDRPYRESRSAAAAVAELRRRAGSQFDPEVVAVLCETLAVPKYAEPAAVATGSR